MVEWDRDVKSLTFKHRTIGTVGRAGNCYIQLPGDLLHQNVSRHHCLVDIDPPEVRVQDLGSRNGTFVNGVNVGQRRHEALPEDTVEEEWPVIPLGDGDEFRVGDTTFRVAISEEAEEASEDTPAARFSRAMGRPKSYELCGSSVASAIP
jgi:pSer/pThr/pTyr-binding forkhead associated (FHA) protein